MDTKKSIKAVINVILDIEIDEDGQRCGQYCKFKRNTGCNRCDDECHCQIFGPILKQDIHWDHLRCKECIESQVRNK